MTPRRALVGITAGALITIALGGCSLLVATDGLSTGADATLVDAADARAEATAFDATDANARPSPASDASDASDASTGPFCASLSPKPKFCADFDMGAVGDYGTINGMPSLDLSTSKSMPASLLSIVEPADMTRGSNVVKFFQDTPTAIAFSFDLFVDEYDAAHDVEVVTVTFSTSPNSVCNVNVAIRTNAWTVGEFCTSGGVPGAAAAHRTTTLLQPGRWTHVDVAADLATSARTLKFLIDGASAFDGLLEPGVVAGPVSITMGIPYLQNAATTRAKIHTDNVTLDYH